MRGCCWLFAATILAAGRLSPVAAFDPPPAADEPGQSATVEIYRGHVPSYPRVIAGKITDSDGRPISGALIEWGPDYPHDAARETVRSDENGMFRLEARMAGKRYKLGVSAPGFAPYRLSDFIPGPVSAPTEINLNLSPETILQIEFVGEDGLPVPSLEVLPMTPKSGFNSSFSMVRPPGPIPGHDQATRCDDLGICLLKQLPVAPEPPSAQPDQDKSGKEKTFDRLNLNGWLHLRISENGKWLYEHQISCEEMIECRGKLRIVIPNDRNPLVRRLYDGVIFGQVVDADGHPIKEFHVVLRYRPESLAVSNPNGCFQLGQALDPKRDYEVRIFAKGFAPQVSRITPNETSQTKPWRIEMTPHDSADLQFVDARTLAPIPNVPVVAGNSNRTGRDYIEWNSLKDYADGYHSLENVLHIVSDREGRLTVPEGDVPVTLVILSPGYARTIVTPALRPDPDDAGLIRIPLAPAASIRGVAAPGAHIGGQPCDLSLSIMSTDHFDHMVQGLKQNEKGECLIDSLAAGEYLISLMHSQGNWSTACWSKKVTLGVGKQRTVALGEMSGTLTLSGRAFPFAHVRISRQASDLDREAIPPTTGEGISSVATFADVDGYFEINHVEHGLYKIEVGDLDRRLSRVHSQDSNGPKQLRLTMDTHVDFMRGTVTPAGSK